MEALGRGEERLSPQRWAKLFRRLAPRLMIGVLMLAGYNQAQAELAELELELLASEREGGTASGGFWFA